MNIEKNKNTNDSTKALIIVLVALAILGAAIFFIFKVGYELFINSTVIDNVNEEMTVHRLEKEDYTKLVAEIGGAEFEIKIGEIFEISTNYDEIKISEKDNTLSIIEKSKHLINVNNNAKVILTIPEGYRFEEIDIELGAGVFKSKDLKAETIKLDLGAGKATIYNIEATKSAVINGGAGMLDIESGSIKNLELNMGVGEANISGFLSGKSKVEAGVGEINLNLLGIKSDYEIKATKGIGDIKVDGKSIENDKAIGDGKNKITVSGGIGAINIKYAR